MPVSNISVVGVRFSTVGAGRWIGQRSSTSTGSPRSIASPSRLKMRPSVTRPTGTVIGPPVSIDLHPAREAVGRVHRDRADAVVAEVLLHLADEVRADARVLRLLGVASRSIVIAELISGSSSGKTASITTPWISSIRPTLRSRSSWLLVCSVRCWLPCSVSLRRRGASAPATTSMISCVISAWRSRFICSVRSSMMSPAFSEALRIAVMRAPCSDAVDSSSARKIEIST